MNQSEHPARWDRDGLCHRPERARAAVGRQRCRADWSRLDLEQFRHGMDIELEHGSNDSQTDVTHDDPIVTGKIALAHMKSSLTTTNGSSGWRPRPSASGADKRS
jgi:hypothetical protein